MMQQVNHERDLAQAISLHLGAARQIAERSQRAATILARASTKQKDAVLRSVAQALRMESVQNEILAANARDVERAEQSGVGEALLDRLRLNDKRLASLAAAVDELNMLPDPVGSIENVRTRPSGIQVGQMLIPLGVILMVYESRPNVTIDAACLCLKAGNAVILRGGKESLHSNEVLVRVLQRALGAAQLPLDAALFVANPEHELLYALLKQQGVIDLAVPRGGEKLIRAVVEHASVPVIQHYKGVCHAYVEKTADFEMAEQVIVNAKVSRPGVCNALEGIVVDAAIAEHFLPRLVSCLGQHGVQILACERSLALFGETLPPNVKLASAEDFDTEFLDLTCTLAVVSDFDAALGFLDRHGSRHSEVIITQNYAAGLRFLREVDASCVLVNASTRFNDGGELGLGAELGISTSKLHAYGPMGLREVCARKFIVFGHGEIRG